jgi:putative protein-disulfide isomerase
MTTTEHLLYGFDPLCGWCFAFRPTMAAIVAHYPTVPIVLAYGGLVVGERVRPIRHDRDYLIAGLAEVQRVSGVAAGAAYYEGLLQAGTYISNSEPPCRAITVVRQLAPERVYAFADSLPHALYVRGLALDDADVLAELVAAQGIDVEPFLKRWDSDAARSATRQQFALARAQGFSTYPTLIYERDGQLYPIAKGYLAPDAAVAQIAQVRAGA